MELGGGGERKAGRQPCKRDFNTLHASSVYRESSKTARAPGLQREKKTVFGKIAQ